MDSDKEKDLNSSIKDVVAQEETIEPQKQEDIVVSQDDKKIILEQYKIYSDAKEKFIDRQFGNNKFYLLLNIGILLTIYILSALFPQDIPVIVMCLIGISITMMWWMNIDSYQLLIKIKYSKVLEYLETKLPEQPYKKEYQDYVQIKQKNNLIVFGDFQKILALLLACVYYVVAVYGLSNLIRTYSM